MGSLISIASLTSDEACYQQVRCAGLRVKRFDDLTGTVFEGHHQPLKVWILCLYLMSLNLSSQQIAHEPGLNKDDAQAMTGRLRQGIEKENACKPVREC